MTTFNKLNDLFVLLRDDPVFKKKFYLDPNVTLKEAGLQFSPDDLATIFSGLELKSRPELNQLLDKKINK